MTDTTALIAGARKLRDHLRQMDSESGEARLLDGLADALETATQWTMMAHNDDEFARLYDMGRILVALEIFNRVSGTSYWQIDTVSFDDETGEIVEDTGWTLRDYTWWRPLPTPPQEASA